MAEADAISPELRTFLEEQRRAVHAQAAALDKVLGYESRAVCPSCGHEFVAKRTKGRQTLPGGGKMEYGR